MRRRRLPSWKAARRGRVSRGENEAEDDQDEDDRRRQGTVPPRDAHLEDEEPASSRRSSSSSSSSSSRSSGRNSGRPAGFGSVRRGHEAGSRSRVTGPGTVDRFGGSDRGSSREARAAGDRRTEWRSSSGRSDGSGRGGGGGGGGGSSASRTDVTGKYRESMADRARRGEKGTPQVRVKRSERNEARASQVKAKGASSTPISGSVQRARSR